MFGDDWQPTDDFMISNKGATFATNLPFDDNHPDTMVAGGKLNLLAGWELYKQLNPILVACEFGNRPKYLLDVNGPVGSAVCAQAFKKLAAIGEEPNIVVFDEAAWGVDGCSTVQELHNLLTLAVRHYISEVHLVTVAVHQMRTALIAQRHVLTHPAFKDLEVKIHASEVVLLDADPEKYTERVQRIFASKSFARTLAMESYGINKVLAGNLASYTSV
jgi:hypothetical protein